MMKFSDKEKYLLSYKIETLKNINNKLFYILLKDQDINFF